jgi:hypothetical protein
MKKTIFAGLCVLTLSGGLPPALAGNPDPNQCLECHEPTEDWAGLTATEIIAAAKSPDNKRHKNNLSLSDEQLRLIIADLLPEPPTE